jgi:hypothetical protein
VTTGGGAGATVGTGVGTGVSVGTGVGVSVGTAVGVGACTKGGGGMNGGGDVGGGGGGALPDDDCLFTVNVLEVAETPLPSAVTSTCPVGLLGTVWTVVELPLESVVVELKS